MFGFLEAFRGLALALVILVLGFIANAILQETVPTYRNLKDFLDQTPSLWVAVAVLVALILTYFGYTGNERRVQQIENAAQRANEALEADRKALRARISQVEGLLDEERRLRGVDVLTGLPNHIRFETDLETLLADRGTARSFSLIYVDLFGLKHINDTQGDIYGSRFIQAASSIIAQAMYRKETIYRAGSTMEADKTTSEIYRSRDGGDEFFLLMKADEKEALFALRRIVRDLIDARDRLVVAAQNPDNDPLDLKLGFRAGIVSLADFDTQKAAIYAVKDALLHTRRQDLPNAPSRYIVVGTAPEHLPEDHRSIMAAIDAMIDGATGAQPANSS